MIWIFDGTSAGSGSVFADPPITVVIAIVDLPHFAPRRLASAAESTVPVVMVYGTSSTVKWMYLKTYMLNLVTVCTQITLVFPVSN